MSKNNKVNHKKELKEEIKPDNDKKLLTESSEIKLLPAPKEKQPIFTRTSITLIVMITLMAALDIWCYAGLMKEVEIYTILFIFATSLILLLSFVFLFTRKIGFLKTNFIIMIIAFVATWGYYLIVSQDLLKYLTNPVEMQEALKAVGPWKYVVFFLIQFLQVTFIPIPAMVTTVAGSVMFGPAIATLLSLAGIMTGSIVAFVIGDKCGEKVVSWIIGEKQMKKYSTMLFDKGKYVFFLMMLFPLFPDDVLCLIAGMTTMSYKFFIITILLTRPIGILMTCYLSVGIPYEGWGLAVWAVLIVLIIIMFWISYKYKDKIEQIVMKLGEKLSMTARRKNVKQLLKKNASKIILLPEKTLTTPKDYEKKRNKKANNDTIKKE